MDLEESPTLGFPSLGINEEYGVLRGPVSGGMGIL
jgi:hypothetical protein